MTGILSLYLGILYTCITIVYFKSWQTSDVDRKDLSLLMSGRNFEDNATVFEIKPIPPVAAL